MIMAGIHLFQWIVAFAAALWLTSRWMFTAPTQRWRHIVMAIVSTVLWIPVAYTAGNVAVATDSGSVVTFGSDALGAFATLMAVVNIVGLLLGLMLWAEEEVDETHRSLPEKMQHRPGRGD